MPTCLGVGCVTHGAHGNTASLRCAGTDSSAKIKAIFSRVILPGCLWQLVVKLSSGDLKWKSCCTQKKESSRYKHPGAVPAKSVSEDSLLEFSKVSLLLFEVLGKWNAGATSRGGGALAASAILSKFIPPWREGWAQKRKRGWILWAHKSFSSTATKSTRSRTETTAREDEPLRKKFRWFCSPRVKKENGGSCHGTLSLHCSSDSPVRSAFLHSGEELLSAAPALLPRGIHPFLLILSKTSEPHPLNLPLLWNTLPNTPFRVTSK